MSISKLKGQNVDIHLWTNIHDVESSALDQLKNIAKLPWVFHHVAVMPDVHYGKGATVGSVIAMKNAVSPAAVGVDIGCGMGAIKTNLKASDLPDNLGGIRSAIEMAIPVGFNEHDSKVTLNDYEAGRAGVDSFDKLFSEFDDLHPKVQDIAGKAMRQVGTLGGGNHFIELCLDEGGTCPDCRGFGYTKGAPGAPWEKVDCETCAATGKTEPNVWLMLHSGSRNIGKSLAEIHMGIAKKLIHNQHLPDRDLAVFLSGTPEMEAYHRDLFWAQRYAFLNRATMFEIYKKIILRFFPQAKFEDPILCHHNYVSEETHFGEKVVVTRKGAIRAGQGDMGIIPGSMGTKSYIVRGRGNPDSFSSASHGAGRVMSRGAANRHFTVEDLIAQTAGVECRKDKDVIDEIPGAYKDIDQVMANQADLVEVVAQLKQVLCVKG